MVDYEDIKIEASHECGYHIEQTVTFFYGVEHYFNGEHFAEHCAVRFYAIKDRKETFNGREINTNLCNGRDLAEYINKELNK